MKAVAVSAPRPEKKAIPLYLKLLALIASLLLIAGVIVWQIIVQQGSPDPLKGNLSPFAMAVSSGILVFREGLEAVLVLAAVTAGAIKSKEIFGKAIMSGVGAAFLATVITWFVVVGILSSVNAPEYAVQAATGLLAVVVLLVVMNWFFHKVYWTGWIAHHSKRKKELMSEESQATISKTFWGLALLGFTAIYREGFEIVLFLQDLRLKAGNRIVLGGAAIGILLTCLVAVLTFLGHRRMPYKRMLVVTGVLLTIVLFVMIGESAQEMQQAHWLATTKLNLPIPDWAGAWFAVFPTVETLVAQAVAILLVVGSYLGLQYFKVWRHKKA
ncbi:MAG TPA: FTR1 family protein [Fimbriimonadaceae bacterium]